MVVVVVVVEEARERVGERGGEVVGSMGSGPVSCVVGGALA